MCARRPILLLGLATVLELSGASSPMWAGDLDGGDGVRNALDARTNAPAGAQNDAEGRPLGDLDRDGDTDLDDYALFQQGFTGPLGPYVAIETVLVGNPGNANDASTGYGGVDYVYNIGKYEVTAGQYTEFLNAVAATDTYSLYDPNMWSFEWGCRIERAGSSGSYTYSVAADWADRPVNFVDWGDAARFANWLHNGQPRGPQDLLTTEDGSYYLNGATTDTELMAVTREPDATWVIPSEDEWYKAAYHKNDGITGNYWMYPTGSDTPPTSEGPPGTDMTNGSANYYDDGYAIGSPYYCVEVGAYDAKPSASPYGTFDQGGNVSEWDEAVVSSGTRGQRGGSFETSDGAVAMRATTRISLWPSDESRGMVGFRVAEVP